MTRRQILTITTDPLTAEMPGPAIRAWHLSEALAKVHAVTLVSSVACDREHPLMEVRAGDEGEVARLAEKAEVIIGPGSVVRRYPSVARSSTPLVIDLYDPYHLENLESDGATSLADRAATISHLNAVVNEDLARGDFFLCASQRQRDFWIGSLTACGRVNPYTYEGDPRLDRLLAVVPFGLPEHDPERNGPGLRERFPSIAADDRVAVWGGGVYNWFDPLSLVRAIAQARSAAPDLRLVFLGMQNPNPHIPEMRVATKTRELADELGLTGVSVFFNEGWVPYEQRANFLLDAQIGVSTSFDHIESRFSFRTRVLDYLWAGLPMVLTEGDTLADAVEDAKAGIKVRPGDVGAIAQALTRILDDPPEPAAIRRLAGHFRWDLVAAPLTAFCGEPYRAADRLLTLEPATEEPDEDIESPPAPAQPRARIPANLRARFTNLPSALRRVRFGRRLPD